eukprot:XP_011662578.1 PREDICTED: uncharacterized protein LOC105437556 [Strongylocentrotus purpuratus]
MNPIICVVDCVKMQVREAEVDTSQPDKTVTDTVLEFSSGEENPLSKLLESGDTQSATQLVFTLTSLLNADAESDFDQAEAATEEEQEEESEFMEEKKTKRAEARESIIANIGHIEVRDMETLQQTSAVIAQVTQEKDEISATAQVRPMLFSENQKGIIPYTSKVPFWLSADIIHT